MEGTREECQKKSGTLARIMPIAWLTAASFSDKSAIADLGRGDGP